MTNEPEKAGKPGEEILHIPKSQFEAGIKQINDAAARKVDDEIGVLRSKYGALTQELLQRDEERAKREEEREKRLQMIEKRPLAAWAKGLEEEPELEAVVGRKLAVALASDKTEKMLEAKVDAHVKKEVPALVKDSIENQRENITKIATSEAAQHTEPIAKRAMIDYINRTRKKAYKDMDELLVKEGKEADWKRIKKKIVQSVAALAILGGAWWMIRTGLEVSRTTAAGAQKTANAAMGKANATNGSLNDYKTSNEQKWTTHDTAKTRDDEERTKQIGKLEGDFKAEIANRYTKAEVDAKYTDALAKYTEANGKITAEMEKNAGRETAYNAQKALSEETRGIVNKLVPRFDGLEGKVATKEDVAGLKRFIDDNLAPLVKKNEENYKSLLADTTASKAEVARLKQQYETTKGLYDAMKLKVDALYEERSKNNPLPGPLKN